MEKYLYLSVDLAAILIPLFLSFHPTVRFSTKWKYIWPAILIAAIPFLAWDYWFTTIEVWGFTPRYLTGIYLLKLPIEEVLFFICIPYASLFIYETSKVLRKEEPLPDGGKKISWILILGALAVGIKYLDKWYPAIIFPALSGFVLLLVTVVKPAYLGRFYFSFPFIFVAFFVVNGILTGMGLPEPVFWYNDNEILGIRIFTIPIEDIFYGMLLILVNVSLFEYFQRRFPSISVIL